MVFKLFFKKSIFSASPASGRRRRRRRRRLFQNLSPEILIYCRKKTRTKNVFFTVFYAHLYPSGLIPPPPIGIGLRISSFLYFMWEDLGFKDFWLFMYCVRGSGVSGFLVFYILYERIWDLRISSSFCFMCKDLGFQDF